MIQLLIWGSRPIQLNVEGHLLFFHSFQRLRCRLGGSTDQAGFIGSAAVSDPRAQLGVVSVPPRPVTRTTVRVWSGFVDSQQVCIDAAVSTGALRTCRREMKKSWEVPQVGLTTGGIATRFTVSWDFRRALATAR